MAKQSPTDKYAALRTAPNNLWYRLHVLVFDLRHFEDKGAEKSHERLDSSKDEIYLGAPYFSEEEAKLIKSYEVDGMPLSEVIQTTMADKLARPKRINAQDYRPCGAHDIAPIVESAFDNKHTKLNKSKHFRGLLEEYGLELKDNKKFKGV